MSKKVGAILLDTRSIQRYVFSCNKLKTNAGASYLVDGIFNSLMQDKILPSFHLKMPEISWQETKEIQMLKDDSIECEIVYIGGGNMLILINKYVDNEDKLFELCRKIVGKWSFEMLRRAPGLKTGVAIDMMDIETGAFKKSLDGLYKQLKQNQNTVLPQVDLPYTGLTLECDISGKTADVFDWVDERWIANEVKSKTDAYKYAAAKLRAEYEKHLIDENGNMYDFVNDLDHIGAKDGESYVCVIHIDGNNMGVKFGKCEDSQERKALSLKVVGIVQKAFGKLIDSIVQEYDGEVYAKVLDMQDLKRAEKGKRLLPIRPIIIGGDDITFVCPGRVGIEYAKRFIEFVNEVELLSDEQHERMSKAKDKDGKDIRINLSKNMSCCGGIAIVPLKYPFFRAYELAEALCGSAKSESRQNDNCLIDFAILYGEMTPTLDQLCRQQYEAPEGYLHYGPYIVEKNVNGTKLFDDKSYIDDLLNLKDEIENKLPRNKVKELRDALSKDEHSMTLFLENCPQIVSILQKQTGKEEVNADDLWQYRIDKTAGDKKKQTKKDLKTRYMDAIEIIDFTLSHKKSDYTESKVD